MSLTLPLLDPWRLEILVVKGGSHSSGERSALRRDVERGLLLRLRKGAYVDRLAYESLTPEGQHIVRMRALAAVSDGPIVFSHFSAGVAHGLPVLRSRLRALHVSPGTTNGTAVGTAPHRFPLRRDEVVELHGLLVTSSTRTVIDVAGGSPFDEGVMAADALLHSGVPRELLLLAVDLAGPRQAAQRIGDVVAFAHPAAESANESRGRVTMMRLGVEVPQLQHAFLLPSGVWVYSDFWFPKADAVAEADGDVKYLSPVLAPAGAGAAVLAEKHREDELRSLVAALARFGWQQAGSAALLAPVLARAGVLSTRPRTVLADYAAAARTARARFTPRRPSQ
ncbi:hypothetical protein [Amnibacterium endophyticum]|uniref:Transcriptional regulator, AbiEi antitoxin, Type IV TA system n=1 Tax=Amnibacterium endophyticum TaxID=2109337 RepID=A0ABW4LCK9_9MICO